MGEGKKGSGGLALILLVVLVGLGGWNYHRNYQIEQAALSKTTFAGYDSEGLAQLAEAYRLEAATLEGHYQRLRGSRAAVRNTKGVGDGVREFERIQRSADKLRSVTAELAAREARVREIDEELARRNSAANGVALHVQRLTGLKLPI